MYEYYNKFRWIFEKNICYAHLDFGKYVLCVCIIWMLYVCVCAGILQIQIHICNHSKKYIRAPLIILAIINNKNMKRVAVSVWSIRACIVLYVMSWNPSHCRHIFQIIALPISSTALSKVDELFFISTSYMFSMADEQLFLDRKIFDKKTEQNFFCSIAASVMDSHEKMRERQRHDIGSHSPLIRKQNTDQLCKVSILNISLCLLFYRVESSNSTFFCSVWW